MRCYGESRWTPNLKAFVGLRAKNHNSGALMDVKRNCGRTGGNGETLRVNCGRNVGSMIKPCHVVELMKVVEFAL